MSGTALIITSISAPNPVLKAFAEGCEARDIDFILIGDKPSPAEFELAGCDFWGLDRQRTMPFELVQDLPERHYARKNLGYLEAIRRGASVILESDDDNFPRADFWEPRALRHTADLTDAGWQNLYRLFSSEPIWPRGFPLEHLQDEVHVPLRTEELDCPIQQGLADQNPDVDAIYRLTAKLPVDFERRERPVVLGRNGWCPFNSQNTSWFRTAFPLLYLPAHCSFRMTDIWRSYVAVRIAHVNGWGVMFHNATVWQERNEHDLMKDFADEVIGYRNNRAICAALQALDLEPGVANIGANMLRCYDAFIGMGLVDAKETPLLEAWLKDIGRWLPRSLA